MNRKLSKVALLAVFFAALSACSSQGPDPVYEPEPQHQEPEVVEPEVVQTERTVFYQVFWQDIHVLTIYEGAGPVRSEEADNPEERFSGRSSYMSAISHYFEHESEMRDLIDASDSLDAFLDRLRAEEDYEVREEALDEGY